jgi:hypothetical protein
MKNLILALAVLAGALMPASAYRDSIPDKVRSTPIPLKDPVQVTVLNGTFQDTNEIAYGPIFELTDLAVYRGFDSTGFLKEDTTFGQFRYVGYDILDSSGVTDSVNIQLTTQCSDYSECGNPNKCTDTSDPWYTVHLDTLKDVSANSAKVEKTRSLSAASVKTCRFLRVKAKEISTALQNKGARIYGEWHRKKRVQ